MRSIRLAAVAAAGVLSVGLSACGSSDSNTASSGSSSAPASAPSSASSSAPASSEPSASASSSSASGSAMSAKPFGAACSAVPKSGPGSFTGMSTAPVATAASANPVLSTLVAAVKKAGLVGTLNSAKDITVFAPANSAFAKIPPATLNKVLADKALLTKILTYHVIGQRVSPEQLTAMPLKSLQGGTDKVTGSGESFTVNGNAKVVCGNVQTANATVYIIDHVLMPKTTG